MVAEVASWLKIAVVEGAIGVAVQHERVGDGRGEWVLPHVGCDVAVGVGGKEDAAHSCAGGVTGTCDGQW